MRGLDGPRRTGAEDHDRDQPRHAKSLLAEGGARIIEEIDGDTPLDEGWAVHAEAPDGLTVVWRGMNCKGPAGPQRACTEYEIGVPLRTPSAAFASELANERNVLFLNDTAIEETYYVWRMGFTYGGVTRDHLKQVLAVTISMGFEAAEEIAGREAKKP